MGDAGGFVINRVLSLAVFLVSWSALLCRGASPEAPVAAFQGVLVYGGKVPRVEAVGQIAEWEGDLLEFLAVETAGRVYESLLTLDCKPSVLQAALLLLGCKPDEKTGTRLALEIAWDVDGRVHRVPAEELLVERRSQKSPASLRWVFTGSRFVKLPGATGEVFLSDAEEAFIGLYPHGGLLIQVGGDFGNPYRSTDAGFGANAARLPPKGTAIKLILRALP